MADNFRPYFHDFKSQLQQLEPLEKKNYLTTVEVIFDNTSRVLRAACIAKQRRDDIAVPKKNRWGIEDDLKPDEIEFSTLVKHLQDHETCKLSSLLKYDFRPCKEFTEDSVGNKRMVLIAKDDAKKLPVVGDTLFIGQCRPCVTKVDGLRYYLNTDKEIGAKVVHCPTEIWSAVNDLNSVRESVCHAPAANFKEAAFEMILAKVEKAYDKLMSAFEIPEGARKELMDDFEKIKHKVWPDDMVEQEMKKLWKERRFCEHLVRYRMDVISDEVQKLNQKVDTAAKERETLMQNQEKLAEELTLANKKFEESRDALAKGIEERGQLLQMLEQQAAGVSVKMRYLEGKMEEGQAKVTREIKGLNEKVEQVLHAVRERPHQVHHHESGSITQQFYGPILCTSGSPISQSETKQLVDNLTDRVQGIKMGKAIVNENMKFNDNKELEGISSKLEDPQQYMYTDKEEKMKEQSDGEELEKELSPKEHRKSTEMIRSMIRTTLSKATSPMTERAIAADTGYQKNEVGSAILGMEDVRRANNGVHPSTWQLISD